MIGICSALPAPITILSALLLFAACAPPANQPAATSPGTETAAPSPSDPGVPSPGPGLFAVLRRQADDRDGSGGADTVVIAGLDGRVRAQASFTSRPLPVFGRGITLLQPDARVVHGKVYYVDALGAVRSLTPDGKVANVTRFPVPAPTEHELSFAVSPDGTSVMASVVTLPAVFKPDENGFPVRDPGGHYLLDIYDAVVGGAPRLIVHHDLGVRVGAADDYALPDGKAQLVGWDAVGPVATVDTYWLTQQGPAGRQVFGVHLVHLDRSGNPGPPVGGADCQPIAELPTGKSSARTKCGASSRNEQWPVRWNGPLLYQRPHSSPVPFRPRMERNWPCPQESWQRTAPSCQCDRPVRSVA